MPERRANLGTERVNDVNHKRWHIHLWSLAELMESRVGVVQRTTNSYAKQVNIPTINTTHATLKPGRPLLPTGESASGREHPHGQREKGQIENKAEQHVYVRRHLKSILTS